MKNSLKFHWIYLSGIFLIILLPLLSAPPIFHPAAWGKSIIFRIIFSILLFLFIEEIIFNRPIFLWEKFKLLISKKSPAFWGFVFFASFFVLLLLSTVFSLDPHFSLWGSPFRGGGSITMGFIMFFAIFLFLVLKEKDWVFIINIFLSVGAIVSILAIFQKFSLFSDIIAPYPWRPISTMGGSIFFALFSLISTFLSLSLFLKADNRWKKAFYLFIFIFLIIGIILAATRAVILGFFLGLIFFIAAYPKTGKPKTDKMIFVLKISLPIIIALGIISIPILKSNPDLTESLKKNIIFGTTFNRVWKIIENPSFENFLGSRGSGWIVAAKAMIHRPILGYGPENFSIGFDKFYDPNLPGIKKMPDESSTSWWDRGHNFIFDIGVSEGIFALLAYLLLFGTIFWGLRKIKINKKKNWGEKITAHGLQTTFLAYLTANFFSFDVFSTYLFIFILIGYSFFLISKDFSLNQETPSKNYKKFRETDFNPIGVIISGILLIILLVFIWSGNIKPMAINKTLNQYVFLSEKIFNNYTRNPLAAKKEQIALFNKFDDILKERSVIDNYVRLQYIDAIARAETVLPEKTPELSKKAIEVLREAQDLRPHYTRSWLYKANYITKYLESAKNIPKEEKQSLEKEALTALEKSRNLSPNRPDIFIAAVKYYLVVGKYREAEREADKCLAIAPKEGKCWWTKALSLIALKKTGVTEVIEKAKEYSYKPDSIPALAQLISIYGKIAKETGEKKYYQELAKAYEKLIELDRQKVEEIRREKNVNAKENFQYHASLAYIYKVLGDYKKAREEAMIVMQLSPESKSAVEQFLKTLPNP